MKERVVTARIDDEISREIEYLKTSLGCKNMTSVLIQAIHNFYSQVKMQEAKRTPFELLEELEMIGCIEGESTLSENYKDLIAQSLSSKHAGRNKRKR